MKEQKREKLPTYQEPSAFNIVADVINATLGVVAVLAAIGLITAITVAAMQ